MTGVVRGSVRAWVSAWSISHVKVINSYNDQAPIDFIQKKICRHFTYIIINLWLIRCTDSSVQLFAKHAPKSNHYRAEKKLLNAP